MILNEMMNHYSKKTIQNKTLYIYVTDTIIIKDIKTINYIYIEKRKDNNSRIE